MRCIIFFVYSYYFSGAEAINALFPNETDVIRRTC